MEGISYIHDETNNKRYVQIDLDKHNTEYVQDFLDGLIAESRKDDEKISLDDFAKELKAEGLI